MKLKEENWSLIIKPKPSIFSFDYKALWRFRDLLVLFVRRDFVSAYKQTILGPLWFLIQPILTATTFYFIFGFAKIPTDGLPPFLFYMSGIILWSYYSECLTKTSDTFTANAGIFGKVYFPRLIVPISIVVSNLVRFAIQIVLFAVICLYYCYFKGTAFHINKAFLLLPFLILLMAGHGLALGIIISSLTTKYRDLKFLVQFGVQLLMYASPVVYPLSIVSPDKRWILLMNPMTSIIETFKYGIFGVGVYDPSYLIYNIILLVFILIIALPLFNKIEKKFMDTI